MFRPVILFHSYCVDRGECDSVWPQMAFDVDKKHMVDSGFYVAQPVKHLEQCLSVDTLRISSVDGP